MLLHLHESDAQVELATTDAETKAGGHHAAMNETNRHHGTSSGIFHHFHTFSCMISVNWTHFDLNMLNPSAFNLRSRNMRVLVFLAEDWPRWFPPALFRIYNIYMNLRFRHVQTLLQSVAEYSLWPPSLRLGGIRLPSPISNEESIGLGSSSWTVGKR